MENQFNKKFIKLLTLFTKAMVLYAACMEVSAQTVTQQNASTHMRWNVFTEKENIVVSKVENKLLLRTLNAQAFSQMKNDLKKAKRNSKYIKSIGFIEPGLKNNVSTVEVTLADSVEIFNFFREREKKHVFDFWKEDDDSLKAIKDEKVVAKTKIKEVVKAPKLLKRPKKSVKKSKVTTKKYIVKNPEYRDFRYGASFIWNYDGFGPELSSTIDLSVKTPEFFYPIKNREYEKNDQEAHLQLVLNFYRKKKYGLMYKSIKLYQEKYSAEVNLDFIEYIKACAIIRDHINKGQRKPLKMAINMLTSIGARTDDYELQKSISKYLLSYYKDQGQNVEALTIAKKFYVNSKENHDYEESQYAAEAILFNLVALNQVEKIEELLKEKTIRKLLNDSKLNAYKLFVHFKMGELKDAIKEYEGNIVGMAKPVSPSFLFNAAEAYFQNAEYSKAITIFDDFISQHSYHPYSSHARLRIALGYEILEKDIEQTIVLYKNAINRSQDPQISAEARIRYAALMSIRKLNLTAKDLENRAFLDLDKNINLTSNHKKLLWLTRLRSFVVDGDYQKGLAYLAALPLEGLKRVETRVFEADGAEIVYGIIQNSYLNSEYSKVVKNWNRFKDRFVRKVANDSYMNFIVGSSYLKLGLNDGFNELFIGFQKLSNTPNRTFPLWVERIEQKNTDVMLTELNLIKNIKLKNWKLASGNLGVLRNLKNGYNKINLYEGVIAFNEQNYKKAASSFENFLANQKNQSIFDPMDLAQMINMYTDSLYELGKLSKFQNVSEAILADTKNYAPANPFMKSMRERLEYLSIEIEAGKGSDSAYLRLEGMIQKFKSNYPNTDYNGRVNYLLGMAFAKNKKPNEARKLFNKLLQDQGVSPSVKELVKSELSLMAIKERTI